MNSQLARYPPVELADLLVIPAEQLKERGLRSSSPLAAPQPESLDPVTHLLHVEGEVLHPQGGALSDRGELGRLEVSVRQAGKSGVAGGKSLQRMQHGNQAPQQQTQTVTHDDQVGVVGNKRAGGTQVEERPSRRRLVAKGVDVSHDVVPEPALVAGGRGQIGIVQVGAHLRDRRLGYIQPQLPLALGQGQPKPAPEGDPAGLAPQRLHGGRRVARAQRRTPALVGHRKIRSVKVTCPSRST